jgi:DNA-binding transcriptional ArsR family regulator
MSKRKAKTAESNTAGRFAYQGLERSMHEKARLGIMTSLLTHPEGVSFNDLKQLCDLTDGNLSRHLEVLQEEGLVTQEKQTGPGRATTVCRLSAAGRKRFLEYLEELQRVIADASAGARVPTTAPRLGWSTHG